MGERESRTDGCEEMGIRTLRSPVQVEPQVELPVQVLLVVRPSPRYSPPELSRPALSRPALSRLALLRLALLRLALSQPHLSRLELLQQGHLPQRCLQQAA